MKISIKTRFIATGTIILLLLVSVSIILWYHHRPTQIVPEPTVNQITRKTPIESSVKSVSGKKNISDEQIKEVKDKQDEEAQMAQSIAFLDALGKNEQKKGSTSITGEGKNTPDSERKIRGMSVEEAHKKGAELKEELNSWLNEAVDLGDVILESAHNAAKISDPVAQEAEEERSRQFSLRQIELIKKIARWEVDYTFLAEDPGALKPGGWIYEMKMKIRPSSVIWTELR